jgi:hypothetical protein
MTDAWFKRLITDDTNISIVSHLFIDSSF